VVAAVDVLASVREEAFDDRDVDRWIIGRDVSLPSRCEPRSKVGKSGFDRVDAIVDGLLVDVGIGGGGCRRCWRLRRFIRG
jgi:hypothetical protein